MFSRSGAREDGSAGDQRQTSRHTTHNAYVLLLFFVPQLADKSQWRDSGGLMIDGCPSISPRKAPISPPIRLSAGRHSTAPT